MRDAILTGVHRIQAVERVIYGTPCGEAVRHEAERTDARRVLITTTKSLSGPKGLMMPSRASHPSCSRSSTSVVSGAL